MNLIQIIILAVIQGAAELLPVSSSAHVIVAEKLMRLDPTTPELTFLLIMLHTGTMFAVIVYFWSRWKNILLGSSSSRREFVSALIAATFFTGIIGLGLKHVIEKVFLRDRAHAEIEMIFGNATLIGISLIAVGFVIVWAGFRDDRPADNVISKFRASMIGAVQGICLPFRGFSRSGATISTAMLLGVDRALAEDFSFALAVILTPPVIAREFLRLHHANVAIGLAGTLHSTLPGLLGMFFSFIAGLAALRWLSSWLETGRWRWFGYYCFCAGTLILLFIR